MKLSVEKGRFAYPTAPSRQILDGVSFEAEKGEILAILGPNGAGKTTLLRCLMGFLHWDSGSTHVDGTVLSDIPPAELWKRMAYVPQSRGHASGSTVEEMVLLGRASRVGLFHQPSPEDWQAADAALAELGLSALAGRRCDEISGGELQMALIARALAGSPECVIFDEPESNLDFRNQLIVLETMQKLSRKGIVCIFNTHYPAHALRYADKALLLQKGGQTLYGKADEVIREETIAQVFGVRSIIGEMETDETVYRDVFPLAVLDDQEMPLQSAEDSGLFTLSVMLNQEADPAGVNEVLHEYSGSLRGRFGMPCPDLKARVITLVVEAPQETAYALVRRLQGFAGVSVKAVMLKKEKRDSHGNE